ncbi:MAG: OmpA family protein [Saprospiraceae bacterium]|nr:OmpA family protein [Saprospiraceae bacterium]
MTMHRFNVTTLLLIWSLFALSAHAQSTLEGYVFEKNNRGFLQQAKVSVYTFPENSVKAELTTDTLGHFSVALEPGLYRISTRKDVFFDRQDTIELKKEKKYLKIELSRKPGYLFDVSIAESRDNPDQIVDAILGATIEIFNRTTGQPELVLKNHPEAFFQHTFEPGNHYTMLIRKPGYLAKRIETYVNIKGCILCVDGVKSMTPGVTDNLTANNTMGTLVTNIELDKAKINKRIKINNIYYDFDKWDIRADAVEQLDKVVTLMKDNPGLSVELGSHTDTRGNDAYNLQLSERRAAAAVAYIVSEGVDSARITSKGYGETELVNRCKNGVECSEEAHQQNRRTELKITGVSGEALESMRWPSLEQIVLAEEQAKKEKERAKKEKMDQKVNKPEPKIGGIEGKGAPVDPVLYGETQLKALPKISKLPATYSGYAIEMLRSEKEAPADHPALRGNQNIFWQKDTDGKFCYFLCNLGAAQKASAYFTEKVKPMHKDARLVLFSRKGKTYLP